MSEAWVPWRSSHWRVSSRSKALEVEDLIDVSEDWCEVGGASAAVLPVAISAALWQLIETLPFRLVGRVTPRERLAELLRKAKWAMAPLLEKANLVLQADLDEEVWMDLGVELECRSSDPRYRRVRVCLGYDDVRAPVLTVALPEEF
jgi:hypothetical protein